MRKASIILSLVAFAIGGVSYCKKARTIYLDDKNTELIRIAAGHITILNFPIRPAKIVLGNKGLFGVEYMENDLAITALQLGGRSNLFVYLDGRRFGFDLIGSAEGGDEIVIVRDPQEKKIKVKVRNKNE